MAEFTLQESDLWLQQSAMVYALRGSRLQRGVMLALAVVAWGCLGGAFVAFKQTYECCLEVQNSLLLALALTIAGVAAVVASTAWNQRRLRRQALSKSGWFLSPQSMVFSDEGLDHQTKLGRSQVSWGAWLGRLEDERNHYLLVEPGQGIIIPKAALSEAERQLLCSKLPLNAP